MSAETPNPQPDDTVRIVLDGAYVREGDPTDHDGGFAGHLVRVDGVLLYVPLSATVEVLERADDPKVGELRREDHDDHEGAAGGHSIWQVQENYDGDRFWCCVYSTAPGNRDVHFPLDKMLDLPVVGYVPGSPAAYAAATRPSVRVPNEPHGLPLDVRQKIANHLRDGDLRTAAVVAQNAGLADMDALSYIKDMSEYQTYLAAHGGNGPRVFTADGPEPPADVSVVEWLAPLVAGQYRYLRRQDDGGWLWSTSPTAHVPEIPATSNTWAGATAVNPGEYREVC